MSNDNEYLTRTDFVAELQDRIDLDLTRDEARHLVDTVTNMIKEYVKDGMNVRFRTFGVFERKTYRRTERPDLKGQGTVEVPKRKHPTFRPFESFKEYVCDTNDST